MNIKAVSGSGKMDVLLKDIDNHLNGGGAQAATASNESAAASTSEDTSAVQTQSVPEGDFLKLQKNPCYA